MIIKKYKYYRTRELINGTHQKFIGLFLFGSLILGIIVALMTGWAVFWLGLLCYVVGVFYAGGPKPLSSLPLGELLSGLTMGYVIFLICLYINSSQNFVWSFANLATTFLIALPNTLLIANLMLANNTCDLEEDEANHRYTIVHYIGKKAALIWWTTALILAFVAIVVAVILGLLSPIMLLILLIAPLMIKFARPYLQKQVKKETFISSVKILMVFQLVQVLLFFVSLIKF